jgi:fatty-acid desaturase
MLPGQIDLTWQHIRLLHHLGLATQVREVKPGG